MNFIRGVIMNKDIEKILVTEEELSAIAHRLGEKITRDYAGKKLLVVGVLKGSIYFLTDLSRYIDLPCHIDFIQASSYGAGTQSSGTINIIKDIDDDLTGFDVLLVEDILDTGRTLKHIHDMLSKRNPNSIAVVTLLDKPARRVVDIKADYVGVDVPNEFVVGYGLDYNQYYRNLPYIGVLKPEVYSK
jgi:hypoxanthine phosphoribosyltransferase